ncbi:MAG: 6-phosphogluconolactonase [Acidobacteria bacterium]|nr:6-phosphogluconolactonase [Acidobacteriota bacterium]MCA1650423.1 6-phosphogluconolactonase [Acidobacteriota bacterium]
MSAAAATHAAGLIRVAISRRGRARIVAATGTSQLEFLDAITAAPNINWTRVELFHLDEYIGLPMTHPASFRGILMSRLVETTGIEQYHWLHGDDDARQVCRDVGIELAREPVDVLFAGIGENAHLAFNDPPADFDATGPYIVVRLDEACRRQQVNEGWFHGIDAVPATAISMTIKQILRAEEILVIVPDGRKAPAVKAALEAAVSPAVPASILRTHPRTTLYLDDGSAALLDASTRARYGI